MSRAKGVAFGKSGFPVEADERVDVVAELSINHWNGSIESQLRVLEVLPVGSVDPLSVCGDEEWRSRFESELTKVLDPVGQPVHFDLGSITPSTRLPGVGLVELISSGERIVVLTADARQRWSALGGARLERFLPDLGEGQEERGSVVGIWDGSPASEIEAASLAQVLLTDYLSLANGLGDQLMNFDRIALLDPPYRSDSLEALGQSGLPVHLLGGPEEAAFAAKAATAQLELTTQLRELFRRFRDAGAIDGKTISGSDLLGVLAYSGDHALGPERAAVLMRVLIETGHARSSVEAGARTAGVVSSEKTELTASTVFLHHLELHKEQERFLSQFNRPTQTP